MRKACLFLTVLGSLWAGAEDLPFLPQAGAKEFTRSMIVKPASLAALLKNGMTWHDALAIQTAARAMIAPFIVKYEPRTDYYILDLPEDTNEYLMHRDLMSTGAFEYVTPNWRVFPNFIPNDTLYGQQWHLPKIGCPAAWDLFRGDGTLVVAIVDTGVRHGHEDVTTRLVPGYNTVDNQDEATYGSLVTEDVNGHGTHMAGCAAAEGNNGKGVASPGLNLRIMPIRVTNSSGGNSTMDDLVEGTMWAVDHGARAINVSYTGVADPVVETAGAYVKAHNGLLCWSAGGSGQNNDADYPDVTIVGAVNKSDVITSWSSRGLATDVVAPGVEILSTYYSNNTSYMYFDGASVACAIVSGVAATIEAANPAISGADAEAILYGTCDDLGAPGDDSVYGQGRVNLDKALRRVYADFGFQPNALTRIKGQIVSGGLGQTLYSDNTYLELIPSPTGIPGPEPMVLEFKFNTSLLAVGTIEIKLESSSGGANLRQSVDLFNNDTGLFERVDTRAIGVADTTLTLVFGSASKYIGVGGLIAVRAVAGPTTGSLGQLRYKIDWVNIKTIP